MYKRFFPIAIIALVLSIGSLAYSQSGRKKPTKKPSTPEVPVDTSALSPPEPKERLPQIVNGERIYTSREVDKKHYIISKPAPHYSETALRAGVKGKVILRAILSANARVTHMEVLSGLPMGLNEACMTAASQIKFLPARKNGEAVSEWVKLEYTFWSSETGRSRWPLRFQ